MLLQIKIALNDIFRNKKSTFVFCFQMVICFVISGYIISSLFNFISLNNKINALGNADNIYYLIDDTEPEKDFEIMNSDDISKKLYELYSFIENLRGFTVCRYYPTTLEINDPRIPEEMIADSFEGHFAYNILYADKNFLDLFSVNISSGRTFSKDDFSINSSTIPVIAGEIYAKAFKLGDVIGNKYKIIGFIEKENYVINMSASGEIIELDNYLILPFSITSETDNMHLYQANSRSIFISKNNESPIKVQQRSLELGLFTYNARSFNVQLQKIKNEVETTLLQTSIFSGLILLVCVVCMYTMLSVFTEEHIRDFVIHLMCGCTPKQIVYRVCLQVFIPLSISFLFAIIIFHNIQVILLLILLFIVIFLFSVIPSLSKIHKNGIIGEIKRSE